MNAVAATSTSAGPGPTQRFMAALATAMRNVTFYAPDHPLVASVLPEATQAVTELLEGEPELAMKFVDGEVVIADHPLREAGEAAAGFVGACLRRDIQSLTFRQGVRTDELLHLVTVLSTDPGEVEALGGARAAMERHGARHISVERVHEIGADRQRKDGTEGDPRHAARPRELYVQAIDVVRNALTRAREGSTIELAAANTTAAMLVEGILRESSKLLGLTSVKDYDEYTFTHMLHITILCLALGRSVALSARQLKDLGVSALLHDVGKVNVPLEYLRKPGKLMPGELAAIQRHPVDGALILCRQPDAPPVAAIVAFEHHMHVNLSGYPRLHRPREVNLFSMLVSIADVYDALTTQRPYRPPLSPGEALALMYEMPTGTFEPLLLQRFTDMLGKYPAGTLVSLSSGELAVVSRPNPGDVDRPFVRVIRDAGGESALDHDELDLAEKDSQSGAHRYAVEAVVRPESRRLNTGELLRDLLSAEAY